jgi:hypothetical protein
LEEEEDDVWVEVEREEDAPKQIASSVRDYHFWQQLVTNKGQLP